MSKPKTKTETQLLDTARVACRSCNWILGECAAEWTERYAKGRTDADFARMMGEELGLTASKVGYCRRVWTDFSPLREQFAKLDWSHFRAARQLPFTLITDALTWANETESGVGEMLAWVRVTHGAESVIPFDEPVTRSTPEPSADESPASPEAEEHREPDPESEPLTTRESMARLDAAPSPARSESASNEPSRGELTATVKQLEAVAQVIRSHWSRFPAQLRDRVWSAIEVIQQHTT